MRTFIKLISILLALMMISAIIVSCDITDVADGEKTNNTVTTARHQYDDDDDDDDNSSGSKDPDNTPVATTTPATTRPVSYVSKLPEEMNWYGEEYVVLGQNSLGNPTWETFEIARYQEPSDIVGKAVWERNRQIKEKYNLVIEQDLVAQSYKEIMIYYVSNDDMYDMVLYDLEGLIPHMQSGYLCDITTLNYVNFDHGAWDVSVNEQFTFGSSVYAVSSDFNLQNKAKLSCIFYNRDMASDAGDGYLEELVKNNQWTLDKFNEIARAYSQDKNKNGIKGEYETDIFGLCGDQWNFLSFSVGAGYRASVADNGRFRMAGADNVMIDRLSKVGAFFFDNGVNLVTESIKPLDYARSVDLFTGGRALFYVSEVVNYEREIVDVADFEAGILPFPKYNTDQECYYSQVNPKYATLCAIPCTVVDEDLAGFGLEVLAETSTLTTYEAYINTKCKLIDSYDQKMSDMYGYIFENPVYDIVIIGDFGSFKRTMMSDIPTLKNAQKYSQLYSQRQGNANGKIVEMMTALGVS